MVCFYTEDPVAGCLDLTLDNEDAGTPTRFCVTGGPPGQRVAIFWSRNPRNFDDFASCYPSCRDTVETLLQCALNCLGADFNNQVGLGAFDSSGSYCVQLPIPCAAGGRRFYFYAVTINADDTVCDSNIIEVTFAPC